MIELKISEDIILEAKKHSEERMEYEFNRFRLTPEQRKSMVFIGTIGQLVLKKYLEDNNVEFEYQYQAGQYDDMDFSINNEIVEVKTSGYDNIGFQRLNLLYSEDQFKAGLSKKFIYCVQIFINGYDRKEKMLNDVLCNTATIAGYISFEDIKNYKQIPRFYADDYKVPLSNLNNFNSLIGIS